MKKYYELLKFDTTDISPFQVEEKFLKLVKETQEQHDSAETPNEKRRIKKEFKDGILTAYCVLRDPDSKALYDNDLAVIPDEMEKLLFFQRATWGWAPNEPKVMQTYEDTFFKNKMQPVNLNRNTPQQPTLAQQYENLQSTFYNNSKTASSSLVNEKEYALYKASNENEFKMLVRNEFGVTDTHIFKVDTKSNKLSFYAGRGKDAGVWRDLPIVNNNLKQTIEEKAVMLLSKNKAIENTPPPPPLKKGGPNKG